MQLLQKDRQIEQINREVNEQRAMRIEKTGQIESIRMQYEEAERVKEAQKAEIQQLQEAIVALQQ